MLVFGLNDDNAKSMLVALDSHSFGIVNMEVDADHGRMVPLVLPSVFEFFDRQRKK